MIELGIKCEEYIRKSGTNIYQFCKKTELDRTTVQKMIRGNRVPSLQFFKKFCDNLTINPAEYEELLKLYKIAKIGRDSYECRIEIEQLLTDFQRLRSFDETELEASLLPSVTYSDPDKKVISVSGEDEIQQLIYHVVEREYASSSPYIAIDDFERASTVLKLASIQQKKTNQKGCLDHFVSFTRKEESGSHGRENVHLLRTILPYTFLLDDAYNVYCSYVSGIKADNHYRIYPHYIVTKSQVLMISGDEKKALLISSETFAGKYRTEIGVLKENSRSLINFRSDIWSMLNYYQELNKDQKLVFSLESIPCVASLLKGWQPPSEVFDDPVMMKYLEAYAPVQEYVTSYSYNLIYGFNGMEEFIKTGRLPELYGEFLPALPEEERWRLIDNYCRQIREEKYSYMLKPEANALASGLDVELYEVDTIIIASIRKDLPFGFIVIKEPGMYQAFLEYFNSLIEDEKVYDSASSSDVFKERCEKIRSAL